MSDIYQNLDLNDPDNVFKVSTRISTFGGPEDVKSGQDTGEFAFGGSSVSSEGEESPENYAAIDPAWYRNGIEPGSTVYVTNPKTGDSLPVVLRDKGPGRWTGRGIDVAPHVLDQLGMNTDDRAIVDFKPALTGIMSGQPEVTPDVQNVSGGLPPDANQPQQGLEDLTTPEGASSYVSRQSQDPDNLLADVNAPSAGTRATDAPALPDELKGVTRTSDGGFDLGNGVIGYENGVIQKRSGNVVTQYIPDANKASGYNTHIFNVKASEQSAPPIPEGVSKEDALKQLSSDDQLKAKMYADYQLPAVTRFGKLSPDFSRLMSYSKLLNPDLDPRKYLIQQQTNTEYFSQKNNTPGAAISATNQALKHLGTLIDINDRLGGSDFPNVQAVEAYLKQKAGSSVVNDFNIVRTTLATEIARALQKGVPTLTQVQEWEHNIDASLGNAQRRSALLRDIPAVLSGQLETMDEGWKKVMGKEFPGLIDEKSQDVLRNKLGLKEYAGRKLSDAVNPVSAPDRPAPVIGKIYTDKQGNRARYTGDPNNPWQEIQ